MVPILSAIVVGAEARRWRALGLSAAYVLGMSVIYTGVGVTAGVICESLTAFLQAPWVLGGFAVLLVALSLSMFGVYELQLPQSWLSRLQATLLLAAGVVLGALAPLQTSSPLAQVRKGVGLLAITLGVIQILGVSSGGRDVLQPLSQLSILSGTAGGSDLSAQRKAGPRFESIRSVEELNTRLA